MKTVGLTGVMGAGKSSVIEILKQEGITVLDCDAINAQLLVKEQAGYLQLIQKFGNDILNEQKEIDKSAMSDLIFSDPIKKKQAENILHPLIRQRISEELAKRENEKLVVVEVPLLFEVKWEDAFDEVWVVACDEETLLERLQKYRHVSKAEAMRRLRTQIPQEEKIARADVIFYNNKDKASLKRNICDILNMKK